MDKSGVGKSGVLLPWPPAECSPNSRVHWSKRARAAKVYRKACWGLCLAAGWKAWVSECRPRVTLEFVPALERRRDLDNCIASMKAGLDGIADALRVDDSRFILTASLVDSEPAGVWVTVC